MAPTNYFHRLKSYYLKDSEPPKLSSSRFFAYSPGDETDVKITYTLLYVVPFYLSAATRPSPLLSRDAPSVIRARIRAVTLSCIISAAATIYIVSHTDKATPLETLRLLGWWPIAPLEITKSLLLTTLLFAGPLFERGIAEGEWKDWIRGRRIRETLGSWIGWRNYVAGPITEELVFRSLLTPLHLLAHIAPSRIIFLTPLYFGIAHIHHFYEYTLTHPHTPLPPALLRSLVQFAYTTVFGWYATFLFLRTGSLPAVVLAHSFCNWSGLPRVWGRVEAGLPIGPPILKPKDDRDTDGRKSAPMQIADGKLGLMWTAAYYVILVAGAVAFYQGFWILTESKRALATFDTKRSGGK
ncbi:hypothetical protein MMC16_007161 [Acarospora aff. strigata]|nr:hypothetical protein [Acarospora aff. strigata]